MPVKAVLDTNVLVSARRSAQGASNRLLQAAVAGRFKMLVSVPLVLEYEAVLVRPENLAAFRLDRATVVEALDFLVGKAEPVWLDFMWRPQSNDPADEMLMDVAINGRADHIVTFNDKDFPTAVRFGISVTTPAAFLEMLK
jgi:putative PIN family toxin of toxin-antitoxin system